MRMDCVCEKKLLMNEKEVESAVSDLAASVISAFRDEGIKNPALIGIQSRGVALARRLEDKINSEPGFSAELGTIDISMYRDDIGRRKSLPVIHETSIPFDINERPVLLVDDILQTGRTIRAALDALTDYGRPSLIRLAILIDRGRREFPIRADFTARAFELPESKRVKVSWKENDGEDAVYETGKKPR